MINIGIITERYYPLSGGLEIASYHLSNALNVLQDVCASVACKHLTGVPSGFKYHHNVYRAKKFWKLSKWYYYQNMWQMIAREKINVLHGQSLHGGGYHAKKLSEKTGIPFIVSSHGSDVQIVPEINYGAPLIPNLKKQMAGVIDKASAIIAVSEKNKQDIIKLGVDESKIVVIPNGIQWQSIQDTVQENLRPQFKLDDNDFLLITVGRNRPIKRLELLFEAMALLNTKSVKCICVGPKNNLADLVKRWHLEKQVRIVDSIPSESWQERPPYKKLINLYRSADMYVSTSYAESFGMAAADSLASGTPILVGKNHGIRDVIDEGKTGFVMEDETPEELSAMISDLKNQRNTLKSRTAEITNSVKKYDWSNIAKLTHAIYEQVLDER